MARAPYRACIREIASGRRESVANDSCTVKSRTDDPIDISDGWRSQYHSITIVFGVAYAAKYVVARASDAPENST